jgi:hypothetical protein
MEKRLEDQTDGKVETFPSFENKRDARSLLEKSISKHKC